jgi:hypothetical protein
MSWFDLPKALRTALLAVPAISDALGTDVESRLHYQELPQSSAYPHVWFSRSGRDESKFVDGSDEMRVERFSFEVVSDSDAETLVDAIVDTLTVYEGNVGFKYVQLVEVEDADDDYIFQSIGEGEPDYLHALRVAVYVLDQ